jgi:hypothetical protein
MRHAAHALRASAKEANIMHAINLRWLVAVVAVGLSGALVFSPAATRTARADDDWEDRWEDYYEDLEDRREEAEEYWEERRERIEELSEEGFFVPHPGWDESHEPDYVEPLPAPRYYRYYDGPRPRVQHWAPPHAYRYQVLPRVYRYYGTPHVGYYDLGRGGAVRVGPIQVFWD